MNFFKNIFVIMTICIALSFGIFYNQISSLKEKLLLSTSRNMKLIKINKSLKNKNIKLTRRNKIFAQDKSRIKKRIRAYRNRTILAKKSALKKLIPKASSKSIPFIGSVITASFVASEIEQLCDDITEAKKLEIDLFGDDNNSSGVEFFCNQMTLGGIKETYNNTTTTIKNKYQNFSNTIKKETDYIIDFWEQEFHKIFP